MFDVHMMHMIEPLQAASRLRLCGFLLSSTGGVRIGQGIIQGLSVENASTHARPWCARSTQLAVIIMADGKSQATNGRRLSQPTNIAGSVPLTKRSMAGTPIPVRVVDR